MQRSSTRRARSSKYWNYVGLLLLFLLFLGVGLGVGLYYGLKSSNTTPPTPLLTCPTTVSNNNLLANYTHFYPLEMNVTDMITNEAMMNVSDCGAQCDYSFQEDPFWGTTALYIPSLAILQLPSRTCLPTSFSIAMWVNYAANTIFPSPFIYNQNLSMQFVSSTGYGQDGAALIVNNNFDYPASANGITVDQAATWNHMVITYDSTVNPPFPMVYINGTIGSNAYFNASVTSGFCGFTNTSLEESCFPPPTPFGSCSDTKTRATTYCGVFDPIYFGSALYGIWYGLEGLARCFYVWNNVLNQSSITELYTRELTTRKC